MREKEIILMDKKAYKNIVTQILNLFTILACLYVLIHTRRPLWIVGPVIVAGIVVIMLLSITIKQASSCKKSSKHAILRCYRWDDYTEGTSAIRIYSDHLVYVEFVGDLSAYTKFKEIFYTDKKIKNLIYSTFYTFIMYE